MRRAALAAMLTVLLVGNAWGQNSPQAVVQKFYTAWLQNEKTSKPGAEHVLAAQKSAFDPGFYSLIMRVWELGKIKEQVEGYDFDPFFATQDSTYSFRLGKQTVNGNQATVPVYVRSGRDKPVGPERMILTAQLRQQNGRWVITDLVYPGQADSKDPDSLAALSRQILAEYKKNHPKK